jgi:hypothetical protein
MYTMQQNFSLKKSIIDLLDFNPTVKSFKRQAKVLHKKLKEDYTSNNRSDFINLRKCQDLVAQQHGYKHWHEFHTTIKKLYKEEKSFFKYGSDAPQFESKKSPINIGYNQQLGLHGWIDQSQLLSHVLINGPQLFREKMEDTFLKDIISQGNHLVYMNGNGEHKTTEKIIQYAKIAGREQDVRVVSFMTPYKSNLVKETMKWYFPKNIPFGSGGFSELIISMMDDVSLENKVWKGRAISLISSLLMALTYMRDNNEIILDFDTIREYLMLEKIMALSKRKDFPKHIFDSLNTYLKSLPDFQENSLTQPDGVLDQHGYLQMQFSQIFGMLSDSYGYLFNGGLTTNEAKENINELFGDKKNYIFIIDFPEFERSTDEIGKLFTFSLGMFRTIMAQHIGSIIEGSAYQDNHKQILNKNIEKQKTTPNKFLFINSCLLPSTFSIVPLQLSVLNFSVILSYDIKGDYRKMTYSIDCFNSTLENLHTKIELDANNNINSNNKWHYKLKVRDLEEDLIL